MVNEILTELQKNTLTALFNNGMAERGFYLTGGTALSEFYLQHRLSDDLDFFTRKDSFLEDAKYFAGVLESMGLVISSKDIGEEYSRFFVYHEEQEENKLKIEFARDVPAIMAPPVIHDKVVVDSFEDIAVNKICAIFGRLPSEPKDFCDLFFILKESRFELDYLINRAKEKEAAFDKEDGILAFAASLLNVSEFQMLPKMIKPLTLDELNSYIVPIAKKLIRQLRPRGE